MQRNISINPFLVVYIILIASMTALVYNYFNPEGLTLISLNDTAETPVEDKEVRFFQPLTVDVDDAFILFDNAVQFIDVRPSDEFIKGHIPAAINLAEGSLDGIKDFPADKPFVIYGIPGSSQIDNTAEMMFESGFNRIYIYNSGMEDWLSKNYPVEE
jgi:rhodanese-related sulfurtransferase